MKFYTRVVRLCFIAGIGFAFVLMESLLLMALPNGAKSHVFASKEILGAASLKVNQQCVALNAYFEDEFLQGLRREATPTGPHFTRNGEAVTHLPEKTNITITGSARPCPAADGTSAMPVAGFGADLMRSLQFKVKWLRPGGDQILPVKTETFAPIWQENAPGIWAYRLAVSSAGAPIDAQIEIDILASNGEVLSAIRGSLASEMPAATQPALQSLRGTRYTRGVKRDNPEEVTRYRPMLSSPEQREKSEWGPVRTTHT